MADRRSCVGELTGFLEVFYEDPLVDGDGVNVLLVKEALFDGTGEMLHAKRCNLVPEEIVGAKHFLSHGRWEVSPRALEEVRLLGPSSFCEDCLRQHTLWSAEMGEMRVRGYWEFVERLQELERARINDMTFKELSYVTRLLRDAEGILGRGECLQGVSRLHAAATQRKVKLEEECKKALRSQRGRSILRVEAARRMIKPPLMPHSSESSHVLLRQQLELHHEAQIQTLANSEAHILTVWDRPPREEDCDPSAMDMFQTAWEPVGKVLVMPWVVYSYVGSSIVRSRMVREVLHLDHHPSEEILEATNAFVASGSNKGISLEEAFKAAHVV